MNDTGFIEENQTMTEPQSLHCEPRGTGGFNIHHVIHCSKKALNIFTENFNLVLWKLVNFAVEWFESNFTANGTNCSYEQLYVEMSWLNSII